MNIFYNRMMNGTPTCLFKKDTYLPAGFPPSTGLRLEWKLGY